MQNDFVRAGAPLEVPEARATIPAHRALLAAFRQRDLPVAYTKFITWPDEIMLSVGGMLRSTTRAARPMVAIFCASGTGSGAGIGGFRRRCLLCTLCSPDRARRMG